MSSVSIRLPHGRDYMTIPYENLERVADLKQVLIERYNAKYLPSPPLVVDNIRLYYSSRDLQNETRLSELNLQRETTVQALFALSKPALQPQRPSPSSQESNVTLIAECRKQVPAILEEDKGLRIFCRSVTGRSIMVPLQEGWYVALFKALVEAQLKARQLGISEEECAERMVIIFCGKAMGDDDSRFYNEREEWNNGLSCKPLNLYHLVRESPLHVVFRSTYPAPFLPKTDYGRQLEQKRIALAKIICFPAQEDPKTILVYRVLHGILLIQTKLKPFFLARLQDSPFAPRKRCKR